MLRGTYNLHTVIRGGIPDPAVNDATVTITSDCPGCDATVVGSGGSIVLQGTGTGWQQIVPASVQCGAETITWTPGAVVNGIVQELSMHWNPCGHRTDVSSTLTRIGD